MTKYKIIVKIPEEGETKRFYAFKEAYDYLKEYYTDIVEWEKGEFAEEYPIEEVENEFKADGYVEFDDGICIMTIEYYINIYLDE